MQTLNQNQPTNPQLGLNLPKPVPPQSAAAQTNTPVKVPTPIVATQKANSAQINLNKEVKLPSAAPKAVNASVNSSPPSPAPAASKAAVPTLTPTPALVQTPTPSVVPSSLATPPASSPASTSPNASSNTDKVVPTEEIGKKAKEKPSKKWKNSDEKTANKATKKKIPTLLGLAILIVSMVAGVLLFGNGTGLFAPRATPATTPQNIVISNVTDKAFTVSFYTDEETIAFIKYGPSANNIKQQASDDRDQLSGVIKPYRLHHITVRGLEPNTDYYYNLGTGSNASFDNNGAPYQITTASSVSNVSPNNQTIYGTVSQMSGQPGEGAIVFVTPEGAGALSAIVKSSGSWAVSLANAFNLSLNAYPQVSEDTVLSIKVQGTDLNLVSNRVVNVAGAQPVPEIIIGQEASEDSEELLATREELLAENFEASENFVDSEEMETNEAIQEEASSNDDLAQDSQLENEAGEDETTTLADSQRTLDLNEVDEASTAQDNIIESTQPIIKANLPPNITVRIEIHSETAIETIAATDANGNVEVDIASLKESLSPGEHSINYTYIDPVTGQEVSKSYDFTVSPPGSNIENETRAIASAQTSSDLPHGTGDPYLPVKDSTPTPIPTVEPIEEATASIRETVVSTQSGTYDAGSTFNTLSLLVIGLFFVATGTWSFFLAKRFSKDF